MQLAFDIHEPPGGQAAGPPVVLLHGLTSSRESYVAIVAELVGDGRRVCSVDLRGHGESGPGSAYRAGDYAGDVAELIRREALGPAVVVGHSLGGVTASALAATAPELVAGLFLEDPPLFEGDETIRAASPAAALFPQLVAVIREFQRTATPMSRVADLLGRQPSPHGTTNEERLGRPTMEARARAILSFDPAAMDAAIEGEMWQGYDPTAAVGCPVTVVAADPTVGAVFLPDHGRWYTEAVPHAEVITIAGQGHGIHEDPDGIGPYLAALRAFLAASRPQSSKPT